MEMIKRFKLLPYCVGVWLFGMHWGYAEYPDEWDLWSRWFGKDFKGYMIPNAYKELSEFQKEFEAKKEKGWLREQEKAGRLRFFWEEKQSGEKFAELCTRMSVMFNISSMFVVPLFLNGRSYIREKGLADFDFEKYVEADRNPKGAFVRCLRVILSEQFLNRVLGEGYVCELFGRCKKGAKVLFNYVFIPVSDGRVLVIMAIVDRDRNCFDIGNYDPQKESDKYTKFEMHLQLTWNAVADEIEEVKAYDKFIVNRPIGWYRAGKVIFEKKR